MYVAGRGSGRSRTPPIWRTSFEGRGRIELACATEKSSEGLFILIGAVEPVDMLLLRHRDVKQTTSHLTFARGRDTYIVYGGERACVGLLVT